MKNIEIQSDIRSKIAALNELIFVTFESNVSYPIRLKLADIDEFVKLQMKINAKSGDDSYPEYMI